MSIKGHRCKGVLVERGCRCRGSGTWPTLAPTCPTLGTPYPTIDTLYDNLHDRDQTRRNGEEDHTHRNLPASRTWHLASLTHGLP